MNERVKNMKNIDIFDFMRTLSAHWILLLVMAIIFGGLFYVKAEFFTQPTYVSDGALYVNNSKSDVYIKQDVDVNDIYTARILVYTYVEIIQTRSFLEEVSNELPFKCSWQAIKSMLKVEMVNDTELLKVTITSNDPNVSYQIAKTYLETVPHKLGQMFANGGVWVIDPAIYPNAPRDKGVSRATAIGVIMGIIIGSMFVLLKEIFNNKFRHSQEIESRYKIPVLGEFYVTNETFSKFKIKRKKFKQGVCSAKVNKTILCDETDFATTETYKSIRTNIMFSMPKSDKGRLVSVTSANPGDGKTTTIINLAITFAQTGAKVILVDCDLRKSSVHKYLGLERVTGVTNVLCGYIELDNAIKKDVLPNLDCLTAGEIPPNPVELINSEEFDNMIEQLRETYDYIFIDTPPVTIVTDAAVIMRRDVGVILIARQGTTTYEIFDRAVNEVKLTGAKIIGSIVLNNNQTHSKYGYESLYKYSDTQSDVKIENK